MSILNYNDKLFFMFDAIRRLILGMSAGIMGIAYLLITLLGFALHVYTVVIAYTVSGFWAAFLTFIFPVFSQIMWVISSIKASGQWINSYTSYVWLYLILCVILWIIIVIFGATAVASSKDD